MPPSRSAWIQACALVFGAASCQQILGISEGSAIGESVGGGGSGGIGGMRADGGAGTGGDAPCDQCAPRISGWLGPVVFHLGSTPLDCPSPWSALALEGGTDPIADPAICSCACDLVNFMCGDSVSLTLSDQTLCTGSNTNHAVATSGACVTKGGTSIDTFKVGAVTTDQATCGPDNQEIFPNWTWSESAIACSVLTNLAACGDDLCVPETPPDFQLCVYTTDDQACPSEYPDKHPIFAQASDTRECGCSSCLPTLGSCGVDVEIFSDAGCQTSVGSSADGACTDTAPQDTTVASVRATLDGTTTTTCGGSFPSPRGDVVGTAPHTFCCRP